MSNNSNNNSLHSESTPIIRIEQPTPPERSANHNNNQSMNNTLNNSHSSSRVLSGKQNTLGMHRNSRIDLDSSLDNKSNVSRMSDRSLKENLANSAISIGSPKEKVTL